MAYEGVDRLISHFLVVAELGSITGAAKTLNMTQPALTRNIQLLEQQLEVPLFERLPKGVALTTYGKVFARRAKFMQLEFDHAKSEIDAFKGGRQGEINVGVISSWGLVYMPEIVSEFRRTMGEVQINIVSDVSGRLVARLLDGELDLICSGLSFPDHPQIIKEPLVSMERVVIASANHRLASLSTVSAEELLRYPWSILHSDEIAVSRLGAYFSAFGLAPPKFAVQCDTIDALLSILRQTDILGTAPQPVADHTVAHGLATLPIQGSLWRYQSGIAYRREPRPSQNFLSFLSCVRAKFLIEPHMGTAPHTAT